jgi:YidC/Oxa1 family membrane protein insertase
MEKRVFLAIVLSFLVLTIYQAYFMPAPPVKPAMATAGNASSPIETTPSGAPQSTPAAPQAPAAKPAMPAAPSAAPLVSDTAAHDVVVETNTVRAVFSTQGAVLKSWRLKKYLEREGDSLVDLVPASIPDTYARPFDLITDNAAVSLALRSALYRPSTIEPLSIGQGTGTLSFEYQDAAGLVSKKTFTFQPGGKAYMLDVTASVSVDGKPEPVSITWGPALGLGYSLEGSRYAYPPAVVQFRNGAVERPSTKTITEQPRYDGTWVFAGVGDQYFLSAVVPSARQMVIDYHPVELPIPGTQDDKKRTFVTYSVQGGAGGALPFFLGPKDFDLLRTINPELVRAINFGMFAWLVVPLLQALKWLNLYIGNYGLSIIALTALINIVIFPLRHRSMVSMRKMQALQPQIKSIQDRYAKYKVTDPERQKMNAEMMALYKEKGVNPASGCVPMLLTMPVLFAFYSMLAGSIELRGAPFFGWIHDLSIHDPYYITPVLMGATMFWQQRMMPSTADPVQQKIFLLMPLIFTFGFLWAPSGLVLYWLMSNLMAIGQQYATNRMIGAPARPAALKR